MSGRAWVVAVVAAVLVVPAGWSQNLVLRNGRTLPLSAVSIVDGMILTTTREGDGAVIERRTPLAEVMRIDAPEPPEIGRARALNAAGRSEEALAAIEPVAALYLPTRAVPGSWWPLAAVERAGALARLGRDIDLEVVLVQMRDVPEGGDLAGRARLAHGEALMRRGDLDGAQRALDAVLTADPSEAVLARAAVLQGHLRMERRDFEGALLAYLRVPAFHGALAEVQPAALLGAARAYRAHGDLARASASFLELIDRFPTSAEASEARRENSSTP